MKKDMIKVTIEVFISGEKKINIRFLLTFQYVVFINEMSCYNFNFVIFKIKLFRLLNRF